MQFFQNSFKVGSLIHVISKSGTTTETALAFRLLKQFMEEKYGKEEASKRILATTDKEKGTLHDIAAKEGYQTNINTTECGSGPRVSFSDRG